MDDYDKRLQQLREEYKKCEDPVRREVMRRQARALEISRGNK